MLFCTIYTNYDHNPLAEVLKLELLWDKYKRLVLRKNLKISQEGKKEKNRFGMHLRENEQTSSDVDYKFRNLFIKVKQDFCWQQI